MTMPYCKSTMSVPYTPGTPYKRRVVSEQSSKIADCEVVLHDPASDRPPNAYLQLSNFRVEPYKEAAVESPFDKLISGFYSAPEVPLNWQNNPLPRFRFIEFTYHRKFGRVCPKSIKIKQENTGEVFSATAYTPSDDYMYEYVFKDSPYAAFAFSSWFDFPGGGKASMLDVLLEIRPLSLENWVWVSANPDNNDAAPAVSDIFGLPPAGSYTFDVSPRLVRVPSTMPPHEFMWEDTGATVNFMIADKIYSHISTPDDFYHNIGRPLRSDFPETLSNLRGNAGGSRDKHYLGWDFFPFWMERLPVNIMEWGLYSVDLKYRSLYCIGYPVGFTGGTYSLGHTVVAKDITTDGGLSLTSCSIIKQQDGLPAEAPGVGVHNALEKEHTSWESANIERGVDLHGVYFEQESKSLFVGWNEHTSLSDGIIWDCSEYLGAFLGGGKHWVFTRIPVTVYFKDTTEYSEVEQRLTLPADIMVSSLDTFSGQTTPSPCALQGLPTNVGSGGKFTFTWSVRADAARLGEGAAVRGRYRVYADYEESIICFEHGNPPVYSYSQTNLRTVILADVTFELQVTLPPYIAPFVFRVSCFDSADISYASLDAFAKSKGYASGEALCAAYGANTPDEFAALFGHRSVESFLLSQRIPPVLEILRENGVRFGKI